MKLLIFVISLFIVAAQSRLTNMDWKGCMHELGISEDEAKSMKYGDQKSKCILACELKKEGIVKDGKVVFDVAFNITKDDEHNSLDENEIKEKVNICIENAHQEANECDVSYVFLECMTHGPKAKN